MMEHVTPFSLTDAGISVLDCEHKTPAHSIDGFPYIAIPDIQDGRVVLETTRKISEHDLKLWNRRYTPQPGDVIVTRRGRVGDTAPIPDDTRCAIGQNLVLLRSNGTHVDQGFLRWAVRSPQWWSEVDRLMNVGAIFSSLNVRDIGQIRLSFPDLSIQQKITEVLDALDDKIAANRRLSIKVDQFLAVIFARVTKGSTSIRMGDVANVNPETKKPIKGGHLRYIDISSVGLGTYDFPEISSWDDAPSRARRHIQSGDTLWSTVRPNRRSHALNLSDDGLLVGSTGLAILRPREVGFAYLYETTKTSAFTTYLENVAEGSTYPAVRANRFDDAPISWASASERDSFETTAAPLRKLQHVLDQESLSLASMRDTLLPQLMSGKLQVKEAEEIVAAAI